MENGGWLEKTDRSQRAWQEAKQGQIHLQRRDWPAAIASFRRAVELDPESSWFHHHLGEALCQQDRWEEAVVAFTRAVALNPDFSWSHYNLGRGWANLKRWRNAAAAYRRAVELEPNFHWSHYGLGEALIHLRRWDEAIAALLKAAECLPTPPETDDWTTVARRLGEAFQGRSEPGWEPTCEDYCRAATDSNCSELSVLRENPELCRQLARDLAGRRQIPGAIILYAIAQKLRPDDPDITRELETLVEKKKRLEADVTRRHREIREHPERWSHFEATDGDPPPPPPPERSPRNSGQIQFDDDRHIDPRDILDLWRAVGWRPQPRDRLQKALENSFLVISVWEVRSDGKRLVGFARVISDGVLYATIWDVAIRPEFQGRGLGRVLLRHLIDRLGRENIADITLFAGSGAVDFYHSLGFVADPNGIKGMFWFCP